MERESGPGQVRSDNLRDIQAVSAILQLLFHTKCCSSIKQVKKLGSSILYTYVKNTTPGGGGV